MKALSIKQPWAYLICAGYKDIENRDWPTNFRGRIYVHAGKSLDDKGWEFIERRMKPEVWSQMWTMDFIGSLPRGAIIGEVDIVDCVTESESPWFVGRYGFVLTNPVLYEKPIPYRGRLGLFEINL
ncbi:MAG: ASCH domain-containing protein [Dehalococcoidia bacterium]|nr:ASCH domain-containing protein [Dehalococcoidia bacterium]